MEKDEVRAGSGLPYFVVGLVVAAFLGGAVQSLLHSKALLQNFDERLNPSQSDFNIQISKPRLVLSSGVLPRFGIALSGVQIQSKDPCLLNHSIQLGEIYLPLDLFSLLSGEVRLTQPRIERAELRLRRSLCEKNVKRDEGSEMKSAWSVGPDSGALARPLARAPSQSGDGTKRSSGGDLKAYWATRMKKDKLLAKKIFGELLINELWVFRGEAETAQFLLKNLSVDVSSGLGPRLVGQFQFLEWERVLGESYPLGVEIDFLANEIRVKGQARIREGQIELSGLVEPLTEDYGLEINLRDLPLEHAGEALGSRFALKGFSALEQKSAWINCEAQISGNLAATNQSQMKVQGCELSGQLGKIQFFLNEITPFRRPIRLGKSRLEVEGLSLQSLLILLGVEGLPGAVSHHGAISGTLKEGAGGGAHFNGKLKGLEVAFSRERVGGKQVFTEIGIDIHLLGSQLRAQLGAFELLDGAGEGQLLLTFDRELSRGELTLELSGLSFAESVENLMVQGAVSPIQVSGKGFLDRKGFINWAGQIQLDSIQGKTWSTKDFSFSGEYNRGPGFSGELLIDELSVEDGNRYFPLFREIFSDQPSPFSLKQVSTQLKIFRKNHGEWRDLLIRSARGGRRNSQVILKSSGTWTKLGAAGVISVQRERDRPDLYQLSGRLNELGVSLKAPHSKISK